MDVGDGGGGGRYRNNTVLWGPSFRLMDKSKVVQDKITSKMVYFDINFGSLNHVVRKLLI